MFRELTVPCMKQLGSGNIRTLTEACKAWAQALKGKIDQKKDKIIDSSQGKKEKRVRGSIIKIREREQMGQQVTCEFKCSRNVLGRLLSGMVQKKPRRKGREVGLNHISLVLLSLQDLSSIWLRQNLE